MNKTQKAILLLIIVIFIISFVFKIVVFDNPDVLFPLAAGLNIPSTLHYIVKERIYKISEKKNIGEQILKYLEEDKNKYLHNLYIQTIGITGEHYSAVYLIKTYVKYQNDRNNEITVSRIIDSMGLIGNEDVVPLLETLLRNYDRHRMQVTRYAIARALYLLTDKIYDYINSSGEKTRLYLTDELKVARRVTMETKGRTRTFEEMIILDKLYRPPGW